MNDTVHLGVRIDPDLKKKLGHAAVDRGMSVSDLVREVLESVFFAEGVQRDAQSVKTMNTHPEAA